MQPLSITDKETILAVKYFAKQQNISIDLAIKKLIITGKFMYDAVEKGDSIVIESPDKSISRVTLK